MNAMEPGDFHRLTHWTDEHYGSFCCPGCRGVGTIDKDQAQGHVSILCKQCGFHETKVLELGP